MLTLNLLGSMELLHRGTRLPLPQSRKTRALLALLAMTERPLRRDRLCEMFWQIPDDPRGALRWSLSKIRALVAADGVPRIEADRTEVRMARRDLVVDALALRGSRPETEDRASLEALAAACRGGFLDDLDLPDAFEFRAWRIAERETLRSAEVRLRRRLLALSEPGEAAVAQAFRLVEIAPEVPDHHAALIAALAAAGRHREAAEQRRISLDQLRDLGASPAALARSRTAAPVAAPPRLGGVPSIAVSGFRSLGPEEGDELVAQALTEELARALAHMPWFLTVVEPGSPGGEADYQLTGTLIRGDGRLRVTYRLLDRATGQHVLSDRLEAAGADLLTAQDEVAGRIAGALEPAVRLAEVEALRRRPDGGEDAYHHFLRGWAKAFGATGMDTRQALVHFHDALTLDPENAPAAIMAAWLSMQQAGNLNPEGMRRVAELARRAVQHARGDGAIIAHAAYVLMFCERDWELAESLAAKAEALSPHSPQTWFSTGWVHLCCGDPRRALVCFDRSLAFSVTHPFAYIAETGRANALLQLGAHAEAAAAARAATNDNPTFHPGWRVLAATLAHTGPAEDAAAAARRLRELAPHESQAYVRQWLPYRDAAMRERLCAALARAGLPEG